MKLTIKTINTHGPNATIGALYVDGKFECFTLEDREQPDGKVYGETRIPAGEYEIALRKDSPMANKYDRRYRETMHDGMLWLRDVPGFEWVYIHIGNTDKDTSGCILVGEGVQMDMRGGKLSRSRPAYLHLYPQVLGAIKMGHKVTLEVVR